MLLPIEFRIVSCDSVRIHIDIVRDIRGREQGPPECRWSLPPARGGHERSSSVPRAPRSGSGVSRALRPTTFEIGTANYAEPGAPRAGRPARSWTAAELEDARSAEDAVPDTHLTRPCACSPPSIRTLYSLYVARGRRVGYLRPPSIATL